jgi:arylsulfatase A-like enzyme
MRSSPGALLLILLAVAPVPGSARAAREPRPNVVIILADDLGEGDLGVYGNALIRTPRIDRIAREGIRFTQSYAAANVCTPSRAGLLTGRMPVRTGLARDVIRPQDTNGLRLEETTIAEALKPDYATAWIGKWHLGHVAPYWPPRRHGFDLFFGLKYSHDMTPLALYESGSSGDELTELPVDQSRLTQQFFDRALRFIDERQHSPFFLVLAVTAPHFPLVPHPQFLGQSRAGAYGDVVEELDAEVGRLMDHLRQLGIDDRTLVIFTSDNGPWFEGSTAGLRDRKGGGAWDGGYRVPFIARQPGAIPRGRVSDALIMGIDLLPTILAWTGRPAPDWPVDGRDISAVLKTGAASPHDELLLFDNDRLAGIRTARWKFVLQSYYRATYLDLDMYGYPLLFDLAVDPAESYNVAAMHPDVVRDLQARLARARAEFGLGSSKTQP